MIVYNSPGHKEQRVNVKPLSLNRMKLLITRLNKYIPIEADITRALLQRLIWDYENLSHMSETQPKWIDVKTSLPEFHTDVLVIMKDGTMAVDAICSKSNKYWLNLGDINNVTHWQSIPEPPIK